jgi:hypothetical protein
MKFVQYLEDAFWVTFMVISQLWDSKLDFPQTSTFINLQTVIQKNVSRTAFSLCEKGFWAFTTYQGCIL